VARRGFVDFQVERATTDRVERGPHAGFVSPHRLGVGQARGLLIVLRLAELEELGIRDLAREVHSVLMRGFTRICFVIMPFQKDLDAVFDEAILPALAAHRFQALRTDRSVPFGNLITAIRDGVRHCSFAVADTTGDRPNVMYELGMAHAAGKAVILLRRAAADGSLPPAPFDFHTESIIPYTENMAELRARLDAAIAAILSGALRGDGPHT